MIIKLICAALGFYFTGSFWGAVLGYFVGSMLSGMFSGDASVHFQQMNGDRFSGAYGGGRQYSTASSTDNVRTIFLNCLLEMSAYVMAADGRIMHSEMETVRAFLLTNFNDRVKDACEARLRTILEERKSMSPSQWRQRVMMSCRTVYMSLQTEQRWQLLLFLAEIAKADGTVDTTEVNAMREIAVALGFDAAAVEQLFSLGGSSLDDAYKVLGVSPDATDDEVRRAYRKMALQYHPDRVATLGADVQEAAKKKFQELNDAKDRIYKARGI